MIWGSFCKTMPGIPSQWASRLSYIDFFAWRECISVMWLYRMMKIIVRHLSQKWEKIFEYFLDKHFIFIYLTYSIRVFWMVFRRLNLEWKTFIKLGTIPIQHNAFKETFKLRDQFYFKVDDFKTRRKWNSLFDKPELWLTFDEDLKMRAKTKPVYKSSFLKV